MKHVVITFLLLSSYCSLLAQNLSWAESIGGPGIEAGNGIVLDASGYIYTTGVFSGIVDFHPDIFSKVLNATARGKIFVTKRTPSGEFVWAENFFGTNIIGMDKDALGNLYLAGYFSGTIDVDPDQVKTYNLTSAGNNDVFILKLDTGGNFVWAKRLGGLYDDYVEGIHISDSGYLYTTGWFTGTSDFDPATTSVYNMTAPDNIDVFISKLDTSGNFVWARQIGGNGGDAGRSVKTDNIGNVYVSGSIGGEADLDPGPGFYKRAGEEHTNNAFVLKLTPSGNFIWGGVLTRTINAIVEPDASGNVFVTGSFSETADLDPDTTVFNVSSNGPDGSCFVLKLSSAGNLLWLNEAWGVTPPAITSVKANSNGELYIGGHALSSFTSANSTIQKRGYGSSDASLGKININGDWEWAYTMGGTGNDKILAFDIDRVTEDIVLTGEFTETADFDPNDNQLRILTSAGGYDIFIVKLLNCDIDILAQPVSVFNKPAGSAAGFTVTTSGQGASYLWQREFSNDSFRGFSFESGYKGAFTNSLQIPVLPFSFEGKRYRCIITNGLCSIVSDTVTIKNISCSFDITEQPQSLETNTGSDVSFAIAVSDTPATYQWQYESSSGSFTNVADGNNKVLTLTKVSSLMNGRMFRCIATSRYGCMDTSDLASLTVLCPFFIESQPVNYSTNSGSDAWFSVRASEPAATYQWQQNTGSSFADMQNSASISGAASGRLTFRNANGNMSSDYRCRISFNGCELYSDIVKLHVNCMTSVTDPQNASVKLGGTAQFTVTAGKPSAVYQWQEDKNSGQGWMHVWDLENSYAGSQTSILTVMNLQASGNGYRYRCIANIDGCIDTSAPAVLSVICPEMIRKQPQSSEAKQNEAIFFTIETTNINPINFRWQANIGAGFTALQESEHYAGVFTHRLELYGVTASMNNKVFRCVLSYSGCKDTTNEVTLHVTGVTGMFDAVAGASRVHIFPNPSAGMFTIEMNNELHSEYIVTDQAGRNILSGKLTADHKQVDLGDLSAGLYFIQFGTNTQKFKLVKL